MDLHDGCIIFMYWCIQYSMYSSIMNRVIYLMCLFMYVSIYVYIYIYIYLCDY